jgi:hypothetical protein
LVVNLKLTTNLFIMKKIISCFALAILLFACKKTELAFQTKEESGTASSAQKGGSTSPTVTTNAASFLTSATATSVVADLM